MAPFKDKARKIPRSILKGLFLLTFGILIINDGWSQSRMYISAGLSRTNGGPWNLLKEYTQPIGAAYLDLEFDKKLVGPVHFLTGISLLNIAYSSDDKFFGSTIEYKANYLAVPVLARWNFRNRNYLFLDFGYQPTWLLNANLREEINQFNIEKVVEGNITQYSTRLLHYMRIQGTFAIGRVYLSAFWISPFDGQFVTRDLDQHWGLNKEQSTYLLGNDYLPMFYGIKAGIRIK